MMFFHENTTIHDYKIASNAFISIYNLKKKKTHTQNKKIIINLNNYP